MNAIGEFNARSVTLCAVIRGMTTAERENDSDAKPWIGLSRI